MDHLAFLCYQRNRQYIFQNQFAFWYQEKENIPPKFENTSSLIWSKLFQKQYYPYDSEALNLDIKSIHAWNDFPMLLKPTKDSL